ncbi:MAG: hypothetical protein N2V73_03265 [Candidatus Methanospirare jalkutatii]|nr:hypothetical protein [Candidatus Methanospirare jalkutatii]
MQGSWRRGSEAKISTACAYGNEQSSGITGLLQLLFELFGLTDFTTGASHGEIAERFKMIGYLSKRG